MAVVCVCVCDEFQEVGDGAGLEGCLLRIVL